MTTRNTYDTQCRFTLLLRLWVLIFLGLLSAAQASASGSAPIAVDDSYRVDEGGFLNLDAPGLLANDTDADADALSAQLISSPSRASQFILKADGSFRYTHDDSENFNDSFTYVAFDGFAESAPATVTIIVDPVNDHPPTAVDDSASVDEDAAVIVDVLGNDSDGDGDALSMEAAGGAAHGMVSVNPDNTVTYTPVPDFNGTDSFTYTAGDGKWTATGTVTVTVAAVNDAPQADSRSVVTDEDIPVTILLTGSDVDGDALSYRLVSGPAHGVLSGTAPELTYTPASDFNGFDSFTFKTHDGSVESEIATIRIDVTPVNDAPTAESDSHRLATSGTLDVAAPGVLENDGDPDGDALTAELKIGPAYALVFALHPDGSFTYSHNGSDTFEDTFTYQAFDGERLSEPITVTLTITHAITIAWEPSFNPAVVGYEVCVRTESGQCEPPLDAGAATETEITGLEGNTLYLIAVRAYGSNGFQSDDSDEIRYVKHYPPTPASISGTLRRPTAGGAVPVANVPVCAIDAETEWWIGCSRSLSNGTYEIDNLPAGRYILRAVAEEAGFLTQYYPGGAEPDTAESFDIGEGETKAGVDFVLNPGAFIAGTIVDAAYQPVPDAIVYAQDTETQRVFQGHTSADGSYAARGLPDGAYRVRAEVPDSEYVREYYANAYDYENSEPVETLAVRSSSHISFLLAVGGGIRGTVIAQADGAPIAGFWVNAYHEENGRWAGNGRTDAEGIYTITGLPDGNYHVRVETFETDYLDEYHGGVYDRSEATAVPVVAGQVTAGIDFRLDIGGKIEGRLAADRSDAPVAELRVDVYAFETGRWWGQAETKPDGAYRIPRLPAGDYRVRVETFETDYLDAYHGGTLDYSAAVPVTVNLAETTGGVDFRLVAGGKISGTVSAAAGGSVLADIRVIAYGYDTGSWGESARTDAEGRYTIRRLPAGTYGVRVETGDSVYLNQFFHQTLDAEAAAAIEVAVEAERAGIDFALSEGGRIRGVITRESDGQPLSDLWVSVLDSDSGEWRAGGRTQADGSYEIAKLHTGTYRVRAESDYDNVYGEHFPETYDESLAAAIQIAAPQIVSGIDFQLAEFRGTDSDWDRLTDEAEVNLYATDPNNADTDGDGIPDADEIDYWNQVGEIGWDQDPDGDGLVNLVDFDSDGDGLSDGYEDRQGSDPADATGVPAGVIAGTVFDHSQTNADLFKVFDLEGEQVFGTASTATNIHSHYFGGFFDAQPGLVYSGRMRISELGGGVGVTFLSQYPNSDTYYRLRRHGDGAFHLAAHPNGYPLSGDTQTDVVPEVDTWYRFAIEVKDTGSRTEIRAKVWAEGTEEPIDWQVDAYDDDPMRLTDGKIGIWGFTAGSKYWDDLAVVPIGATSPVYFDDFEDYPVGSNPSEWINTGADNSLEIESFSNSPLTGAELFVALYSGDPCSSPQFIERVGLDVFSGTFVFEGLEPNGGPYYLKTERNGYDFLEEWWAVGGSSAYCLDAMSVDVSAGGVGGIDFQLDGDRYPVANDDQAFTIEDTPSAPIPVVENDTDADGGIDPATVKIVTPPEYGAAETDAAGNVVYTPEADFSGTDSFAYTVRDNRRAVSEAATVTVVVEPVNDTPMVGDEAIVYSVGEGETLTVAAPGVLASCSDPDGDMLSALLVRGVLNGELVFSPDGSWRYTHDGGESAQDRFSFQVNDGAADSEVAEVLIQIVAVDDPLQVRSDAYGIERGGSLSVDAGSGLLANDSDADDGSLTVADYSRPQYAATFTVAADGSFTYTHDGSSDAGDAFTYQVSNGRVLSDPVSVIIVVGSSNRAPVASPDTYGVDEGGTLSVGIVDGVLANDGDSEQPVDALSVARIVDVLHGALVLEGNGAFTYTHDGSENFKDRFTYQVSDGNLLSTVATVSIAIAPVNDVPAVQDDAYSLAEDSLLNIAAPGVLANDHDADLPPEVSLTAVLAAAASSGTLTLNADGSFVYEPQANFTGADQFSYRAYDGQSYGQAATVRITVSNFNDPPVVTDGLDQEIQEGESFAVFQLDDHVQDPDHAKAQIQWSVSGNQDLAVDIDAGRAAAIVIPDEDWYGEETIVFTATDPGSLSGSYAATFRVNGVNDPPAAVADSFRVNEGDTLAVTKPGVLANDIDVDNAADTLTVVLSAGPGFAADFELYADGSFAYTHDGSETTGDSFSYYIDDGEYVSDPVEVSLAIDPVNEAPILAEPVRLSVAENAAPGTPADIVYPADSLLAADPEGEELVFSIVAVDRPPQVAIENVFLTEVDSAEPQAVFEVHLSEAVDWPVTLEYATTDGTAAAGGDYLELAGTVVFDPGMLTATITVPVYADGLEEGLETFFVELSGAAGAVIADPQGRAVIADNGEIATEPPLVFVEDLVVTESDDGLIEAVFAVTLSAAAQQEVTVRYATVAGTAQRNLDYLARKGTLVFAAGETRQSVAVEVFGDSIDEADETFFLTIDTAVNAQVGDGRARALIIDDYEGEVFAIDRYTGEVYTAAAAGLDYETLPSHRLIVRVADNGTPTLSATATWTVEVVDVNEAPEAAADAGVTDEDTPVSLEVLANDRDVDGDLLRVAAVGPPANGSAVINADDSLTYTPDADFFGEDRFTYTIRDGDLEAVGTVTVSVESVNDAPVAMDQTVSIAEDTDATVSLTGSDVDGDALSFQVVEGPDHGVLSGTVPQLTYRPDPDFHGSDRFTFTVSDGALTSDPATVSIAVTAVNDAPSAAAQSVQTIEDTDVVVTLAGSDVEGDALSFEVVSQPLHGTLGGVLPELTYSPDPDFHGSDSFTFTAGDGAAVSKEAAVRITVTAVNDAPVAADDSAVTDEDTPLTINVLGNDSDVDGDSLSVTWISGPSYGTAAVNADQSVTYTPGPDFHGSDQFAYTVGDGNGAASTAEVSPQVTAVNDAPVALDTRVILDEDTAITIEVLTNVSDVDQDTLQILSAGGAMHGTLTVNPDHSITYTPASNYFGSDAFSYTVSDGELTADGRVDLTVNAVNDPPEADDQVVAIDEDMSVAITLTGSDAEGESLEYRLVSLPANGKLSGKIPTLTYTPKADFYGEDRFTFTAGDPSSVSAEAVVRIEVSAINDAPTISAIADQRIEENPATAEVAFTIGDAETAAQALTVTAVSADTALLPETNLLVEGAGADRILKIMPSVDLVGVTTITVRVSDGVLVALTTFEVTINTVRDYDSDGITNAVENIACTDDNDADSDDDGIADGIEDANQNGTVDFGETNPCLADTDGDGLQDGTELGYTLADITADTDIGIFEADLDPDTTTNPLEDDTDKDGLLDGQEDANHNGRVDPGETNPNVSNKTAPKALPWLILLIGD